MKAKFILNENSGLVHKVDGKGKSFESCNLDAIARRFRKEVASPAGHTKCKRCFAGKK